MSQYWFSGFTLLMRGVSLWHVVFAPTTLQIRDILVAGAGPLGLRPEDGILDPNGTERSLRMDSVRNRKRIPKGAPNKDLQAVAQGLVFRKLCNIASRRIASSCIASHHFASLRAASRCIALWKAHQKGGAHLGTWTRRMFPQPTELPLHTFQVEHGACL